MLEELHEMTTRIEKLSKAEHDLISDVHLQVSEIKEHVQNVEDVVRPKTADLASIERRRLRQKISSGG
jgi:hypothetical protein